MSSDLLKRKAKIVATIGPASRSEQMLRVLIQAGMNVARLNFSHGAHEDHGEAGLVQLGRGLPRYVERDFAKYLECGVLAHGFARVRCESCKDELLVAFSCKGRGVCPSCNAKRAHVTAAHLVERVLPVVRSTTG